ncbi:MAG TPA: hypothetical protein VM912_19230 [Terriglobales bacterium]|nr:hypothetical protein [Terriglobales bacterium]
MNQAFHIFRKDVRHFWKEIILSWGLLGLFVYQAAHKRGGSDAAYLGAGLFWQLSAEFVGLLLILSWWTLIVRLIHDESLAGDRQFWVTRPYRWPQLLAEKILFIVLYINLPLLVGQVAILKLTGFPALTYLGGLLTMQATITMIFLLPVFLLAVVSARFVQVIVAGFAAVLYLSVHSFMIEKIPNSSMQHAASVLDTLFTIIAICAVLTVIFLQYGRRQTLISRSIIGATALLMTLFAAITPYESLIAREFPRTGENNPLRIALDTRTPEKPFIPPRPPREQKTEKKISIAIPLLSSTSGADIVAIRGMRFSFDLPKGRAWRSNWQGQYGIVLLPDSPEYASFQIPKEIFNSMSSTSVDIKLELALALYRRGRNQWQIRAEDEDFPAPQLGICKGVQYPTQGFQCRAPLQGPGLMLASVESSQSTCPVSNEKSSEPAPNITAYFWSLSETMGYGAIIDPIVDESIYFSPVNLKRTEDLSRISPRICPGTQIDFTSVEFVRHTSMIATLNSIRLRDYRQSGGSVGFGGAVLVAR